jgi:hypothetical protein
MLHRSLGLSPQARVRTRFALADGAAQGDESRSLDCLIVHAARMVRDAAGITAAFRV